MVLAMLQQMESTLLGLQRLRGYVGNGAGQEALESLIKEMQTHLAATKRKLTQ
jgi:hypothetical protein